MEETASKTGSHSDFECIQGAWKIALAWTSGKRSHHTDGIVEVFQDGNYWWDAPHLKLQSDQFLYRINPETNPKSIDVISGEGVLRGIYRLTKQTLTTCFPDEDALDRPTEFMSCGGRRWNMSVAKRLAICPQRLSISG